MRLSLCRIRLSAESNARCIGKTYEVLVEGVSKRSREQLVGRTEQNRVVVFDRGTHRVGDFVMVKITEASSATAEGGRSLTSNIHKILVYFYLHACTHALYLPVHRC